VTDSGDLSSWRSLGDHQVLAADFESAGERWDAVFPSEFTEPVPDWLRAELPDAGWREVTVHDGGGAPNGRRLLAAPKDGRWATAWVWLQSEGPPVFMGDLSTYRLRPTREIRRQGLALSWTEPLRVAASELNAVTVTLTNTSDSHWTPDSEDHPFVHGHVLDDAGHSPANCSFAYGLSQGDWKVSLAPGESTELPVIFSHDKPSALGSHTIEAILVSLNLRSPEGTLQFVADADEAPRMTFNEAQLAKRRLGEDADRAAREFIEKNSSL
jgi:hypothetical protein